MSTASHTNEESYEPFPAAEGLEVVLEKPTAPAAPGAQPPQTGTQPHVAQQPEAAASTITQDEPPVVLKGIHLDPLSTMSAGSVVERSDAQVVAGEGDAESTGEPQQFGGLVGLLQKHGKVLAGAAVAAVIGFALMPKTHAPVAAPVAVPVVTAPVVTAPAPAPVGVVAPNPGVGVTGGVEAYVGSGSPDDQSRLAAELQRDAQAIPTGEQVCSNPAITGFDSMRCGQVGPALYFKCAPDGRRWDVRKPGCENG